VYNGGYTSVCTTVGIPQCVQRWVYSSLPYVHHGGYTLLFLCAPRSVYLSLSVYNGVCTSPSVCTTVGILSLLAPMVGILSLLAPMVGILLSAVHNGGYSPLSCAQRWVISPCSHGGYSSCSHGGLFLRFSHGGLFLRFSHGGCYSLFLPWWVIPSLSPWWVIPSFSPWWLFLPALSPG